MLALWSLSFTVTQLGALQAPGKGWCDTGRLTGAARQTRAGCREAPALASTAKGSVGVACAFHQLF